ncbi:outer membrane protein assembly factor BamA [bacterium endosymbiont of Pedicinus badii]|uniref:outer membrane protein assembly factor BamA n=1 Tax=bacterium endosymbiont of Pedicinus badii TaxID=1719126 RepID=UPI0018A8200F|nr:outer membrane protein assembly factor BamA [bacterium endosymbiont of Pedicinus badii]
MNFIKKLFFVFLLLYFSSQAEEKTFFFENLKIEGLQRVSNKFIRKKISKYLNREVSEKEIQKIIFDLYETKFFNNIKVLKKNKILIIQLYERPIIEKIDFNVGKNFKIEQIEKIFVENGIEKNSFFDRSKLFKIKKIFENFFYENGQYFSYIEIKEKFKKNNTIAIQVQFIENDAIKIAKVSITGNKIFQKKVLEKVFFQKSKIFSWKKIKTIKYSKFFLEESIKNLKKFYFNKGYANFKIISIQNRIAKNRKRIFLNINIYEGEKYKISKVVIKNKEKEDKKILKIINNIKIDSFYKKESIEKVKEKIISYLEKIGFPYPEINVRNNFFHSNRTIELEFYINKGKRYQVRNIIFSGNYSTRDFVLRRNVPQIEGSWMDIQLVRKGRENLIKTDYFEEVLLYIKNVSYTSNIVDIIYVVKEKNTGSFNIGAGFGTQSKLNFQFRIQQENFLGSGNTISFIGTKNQHQSYLELYSRYSPMLDNYQISNKLSYTQSYYNKNSVSEYNLNNFEIEKAISFPITEKNRIKLGINFSRNQVYAQKVQVDFLQYFKNLNQNSSKLEKIKENEPINLKNQDKFFVIGWIFNSLNREYFSNSGMKNEIYGKVTLPTSTNKYYKFILENFFYIPIDRKKDKIFMNHLYLGFLGKIKKKQTPFYDNFFYGGPDTIRGFKFHSIGPKSFYYKNSCKQEECLKEYDAERSTGGNVILFFNTEFIFPIPFFSRKNQDSFRNSIFLDSGILLDTNWNKKMKDVYGKSFSVQQTREIFRISSGISWKWITPVGLLNFSYSVPIKKLPEDKIENFQFNLGSSW